MLRKNTFAKEYLILLLCVLLGCVATFLYSYCSVKGFTETDRLELYNNTQKLNQFKNRWNYRTFNFLLYSDTGAKQIYDEVSNEFFHDFNGEKIFKNRIDLFLFFGSYDEFKIKYCNTKLQNTWKQLLDKKSIPKNLLILVIPYFFILFLRSIYWAIKSSKGNINKQKEIPLYFKKESNSPTTIEDTENKIGFIWGNIWIALASISGLILFVGGLMILKESNNGYYFGLSFPFFISAIGIYRRKKMFGLYFTFGVLIMNLFINLGMLLGISKNIPAYLLLFLIHILWGVYFYNRRKLFIN